MLIYQDDTGYIIGYERRDGFWWISEFVIRPEYRGQGLAKKLAEHLPRKCKLQAQPFFNMKGKMLDTNQLIRFYESIGFIRTEDEYGNVIMERDQ